MRIFLVEDDNETAAYILQGLNKGGHLVDRVANGEQALPLASTRHYDVVILDWMLPGLDGLKLLKSWRALGIKTPILFLTARGGIDDRVQGLEAGGDDYLTKPFAFSELLARINALYRRPPLAEVQTILRVADLEIDLIGRRVRRGGKAVELQPREFRLLEYLMRNAGRVVTRTMLLEQVWDFHFDPKTKIVETHISRLRAKVDRVEGSELIHTIRGSGYVLRPPS